MVKVPQKWQEIMELPDPDFVEQLEQQMSIPDTLRKIVQQRINRLTGQLYDNATRSLSQMASGNYNVQKRGQRRY